MQFVLGQALITISGDRSKVKINKSYYNYVKIGQAAFHSVCSWSSTHCHAQRLPCSALPCLCFVWISGFIFGIITHKQLMFPKTLL